MIRMLASVHDEVGDVAVPGLVRGAAAPLDYPEDRVVREAGMLPGVGLLGSGPVVDRLWHQPSITVTGTDATPTAEAGNALMSSIRARLSLRLAPGQDPDAAVRLLEEHLRRHLAWGAHLDVTVHEVTAPVALDTSGPAYDAMRSTRPSTGRAGDRWRPTWPSSRPVTSPSTGAPTTASRGTSPCRARCPAPSAGPR